MVVLGKRSVISLLAVVVVMVVVRLVIDVPSHSGAFRAWQLIGAINTVAPPEPWENSTRTERVRPQTGTTACPKVLALPIGVPNFALEWLREGVSNLPHPDLWSVNT